MVSVVRKGFLTLLAVTGGLLVSSTPAAASECNLVIANANQEATCTIGTGVFYTDEQHPTGTGFVDSFLRIQQNTWEQGYNTSSRPVQDTVQVKVDPNFTRDLLLSEVGTKTLTVGGVTQSYYEFFLDINEPAATNGSKNYITLDQLEIYAGNTALLNYYQGTANTADGSLCVYKATGPSAPCKSGTEATKIYDLDAGGDNYITLDYLVKGSGSGSSDMVFYLPTALFSGQTYVTLFSQFGDKNGLASKYESQAGFEEWFTHELNGGSSTGPVNPVPEPASLLLLGSGLGLAARRWRQSRRV